MSRGKIKLFRQKILFLLGLGISGCSLFATRPAQELSDAQAALHAAKEVKADTLSAENYRLAREAFVKARREYRFQNYAEARSLLETSKRFSERAEFEAMRRGADRLPTPPSDPLLNAPQVPDVPDQIPPEVEQAQKAPPEAPTPNADPSAVTLETYQEMKKNPAPKSPGLPPAIETLSDGSGPPAGIATPAPPLEPEK